MSSTLRIKAELKNLATIRRFIAAEAESLAAERTATEDMIQAVDESATNVIRHGYKEQPGVIEVEIAQEGETLLVRIRDQAPPFDPSTYPSPDLTLPLEQRRFGGMGIHLTRECTEAIHYRRTPDGANELTLLVKAF